MSQISRKEFLKLTSAGALGFSVSKSRSLESFAARQQPNIVFIFVDDMGYGDLSCYGNCELETPNMDRLADEGIRFTNYYVSSPICSPSRVGVTTGQYPSRHRINSFLASRKRNQKRDMANYLDPQAPSIARSMKATGYATAHFGKWHMGGGRDVDDAPLPQAYGFDESLVSFEGLGDRLLEKDQGNKLSKQSAALGQGDIQWVDKWQKTGIYVDRTIDFMEQHQDEPFYIHLWPGDVHDPHKPKPEWRDEFGEYDKDHYKRDFFAVLDHLDQQVGRVLDKLDELGLTNDTMVVLASDNGPTDWPRYYNEHYWPPGDTGAFRGRKWSLYEGGIRMPLMVRLPGLIPKGEVDDSTVIHSCDFFPTFCSMAGVSTPEVDFDGQDMSSVFRGNPTERNKPVFWEYGRDDSYLQPGNPRFQSPNLAIRDGQWKLLINDDETESQLYNLVDDQAETSNLANQHPEIAQQLSSQVLKWRKSLP